MTSSSASCTTQWSDIFVLPPISSKVTVLPPDAAFSHWDCTLERNQSGEICLRLGLRQIDGLKEDDAHAISSERGYGYRDFAGFVRRTGLPKRARSDSRAAMAAVASLAARSSSPRLRSARASAAR